jgi:hypothetical protein
MEREQTLSTESMSTIACCAMLISFWMVWSSCDSAFAWSCSTARLSALVPVESMECF